MSSGLMFLALLPGILIIYYVYKKDKVEKEPWRLIIRLMFFGALSCIPAAFFETMIDAATPSYQQGTLAFALSNAFLSAALCEEIFKFLFLKIGAWRNPAFGYRFDGIVYGVSVAVGFAVLENLMYVSTGGLEVALMRGVLSVPLHAFCGVFMGIFFGAAKAAQVQGKSSLKYQLLALIVPMIIHGVYDTFAFLGNSTATIALLAFVLIMYIVSIRYIRQFSRDDWQTGFYPETRPLSQQGSGQSQQAGWGGGQSSGGYRSTQSGYRAHPGQVQDGKVILLCPNCRRGMRVPVGMGQVRVRCPHCGKEFTQNT